MRTNNVNFGLKRPTTDFEEVRDGRRSLPLWLDIDLASARTIGAGSALTINLAGNSFYIDADTSIVGNATIHFQDTNLGAQSAPLFVSPGFIANVPFTQILVENTAQAGKRLRIFYGVDIDFQAGVNTTISMTGSVDIASLPGNDYANSYTSTTNLVANTPEQIFSPAFNTNGVLVSGLIVNSLIVGGGFTTILAKSSAPANVTDGDVILGGYYQNNVQLPTILSTPIEIPAGKGLYAIASAGENIGMRACLYKAL